MNLKRSLSRHQSYYLGLIADGKLVLVRDPEDPESKVYIDPEGFEYFRLGNSKPRRGCRPMCGNHKQSALVELCQRGLLIDMDGRLVPSREASKQYGTPPPLPKKRRVVVMSRTRAARVQPEGK
jgi:hypothetical protein